MLTAAILVVWCLLQSIGGTQAAQAPTQETNRIIVPGPAQKDSAAFAQSVKRFSLAKKAADMNLTFPNTSAGKVAAIVATLVPYGQRPYNPDAFSLMGQELKFLNQHPADSLTAIEQGFAKLPDKYWAERQFLIQFAARLPVDKRKKLDFLAAELARPAPSTSSQLPSAAQYTGAIALDAILQITDKQSEVESILVPALKIKTTAQDRKVLLSRYRLVFPAAAARLSTQFGLGGSVEH